MAPLTVIHVLGYDDDRGGVLTSIRLQSQETSLRHVLGVNRGFVQRREPQLPCRELPRLTAERLSPRTFWAALRVALMLASRAAPHEVVHGQSRAGLVVAFWLWLLGHDRVFASPHCYGRQRWFYRWLALCLGERWRWLSPAMKRYYGVGAGWENCIPEPLPPGRPVARRTPDGMIVLGGAGNLVRWKNWQLVPEALSRLPIEMRCRYRFRHVGDRDGSADSAAYADELLEQTQLLGVADQVEWRGWCADMPAFWNNVDYAVVCSENEPMSLAGLEALAADRPLILADSGGLNDIVMPGREAFVFRTGDANSLATVLAMLARDTQVRQAVVPARLPGFMTAEKVASAWRGCYDSLTGGGACVV